MKTNEYDFTLKFGFPDPNQNPEDFIDALYEAGCDDALVGIGKLGSISLNFTREAESAIAAVTSAILNIKMAIPFAEFIEVSPDLVGISDVADIIGCSRQNVRKMITTKPELFPFPAHEGNATFFNLAEVLARLAGAGVYSATNTIMEVAKTNMQVNLARKVKYLDSDLQQKIKSVI